MKIKRIPKSFMIGGKTFKIIKSKNLDLQNDKMGLLDFLKNKIYIQSDYNLDQQRHTLRHEQVHAIFFSLGKEQLARDEELVDSFALLLDQVLETEKY